MLRIHDLSGCRFLLSSVSFKPSVTKSHLLKLSTQFASFSSMTDNSTLNLCLVYGSMSGFAKLLSCTAFSPSLDASKQPLFELKHRPK